jgi:hypothetical protein
MLVFVPLARETLRTWAGQGRLPGAVTGHAVTPRMAAAFGFGSTLDEDAEHTALHIAGLAGLLANGERLVAVVEAPAQALEGDLAEFGAVSLREPGWPAVTALFVDDPEQPMPAVAASSLAAAWDVDDVVEGLSDRELLWHAPTEWGTLVNKEE